VSSLAVLPQVSYGPGFAFVCRTRLLWPSPDLDRSSRCLLLVSRCRCSSSTCLIRLPSPSSLCRSLPSSPPHTTQKRFRLATPPPVYSAFSLPFNTLPYPSPLASTVPLPPVPLLYSFRPFSWPSSTFYLSLISVHPTNGSLTPIPPSSIFHISSAQKYASLIMAPKRYDITISQRPVPGFILMSLPIPWEPPFYSVSPPTVKINPRLLVVRNFDDLNMTLLRPLP